MASLTKKGTIQTTHWFGAIYQINQFSPKERTEPKRRENRRDILIPERKIEKPEEQGPCGPRKKDLEEKKKAARMEKLEAN